MKIILRDIIEQLSVNTDLNLDNIASLGQASKLARVSCFFIGMVNVDILFMWWNKVALVYFPSTGNRVQRQQKLELVKMKRTLWELFPSHL